MSGKWSDSLYDRIVRQMQGLPPMPPKNGEMLPPSQAEMPGYTPPAAPQPQLPEPGTALVPVGPRALTAPPSVTPGAGIPPWMALLGESAARVAPVAAFLNPTEGNPAGLADTPPPKAPDTVVVKRSAVDNFGTPVANNGAPKMPSAAAPSQASGSILNPGTKKSLEDVKSLDDLGDRIKARLQERQAIESEMKAPPAPGPQDIQSMKELQNRVDQRLKERQGLMNQLRKGQ